MAVELNQRYADILDEMLDSDLSSKPSTVTVQVQGKTIRFQNIGDVASWISSIL
jgi:hypothetical protein